jgi:DNA-binding CsgD family transcriptional regulator
MVTIRGKKDLFELGRQISELEEPEEIWTHFLDGLRRVAGSHSRFLQQKNLSTESLPIRNRTRIILTFHRDKPRGDFNVEDMKLFNHLVPVLYENLCRVSDKNLLSQQSENASAYIDSDLRILESNKAFQDTCFESFAIDVSDGRFNLTDPAKATELSEQICQLYNRMATCMIDATDVEMSLFDRDGNIELGLTLKPDSSQVTRYGFCETDCCLRLEIKKYHYIKINWQRVGRHYALTPSELEVLKLVYENLSRAEIAKRRNCSPETIKTQVHSIENKLGANTQLKIMKLIHSHSYFIEEI